MRKVGVIKRGLVGADFPTRESLLIGQITFPVKLGWSFITTANQLLRLGDEADDTWLKDDGLSC